MNLSFKRGTLFLFQLINKFGLFNGVTIFLKIQWTGSEKIGFKINGRKIYLRSNTSDLEVFKQIFLYEQYKIQFDFDPKVIIDGGGNIGLSALYFHSLFPNADLFVVEPDQHNFLILKENVSELPKITCIESALWNVKAKLFLDANCTDNWSRTVSANSTKMSQEVPTITLPELMEKYGLDEIDILKLDIESSEKQLFASNYEPWLKKVKVIIIELHDDMLNGCSMAFFSAVSKSMVNYRTSICGENLIIFNDDLLQRLKRNNGNLS